MIHYSSTGIIIYETCILSIAGNDHVSCDRKFKKHDHEFHFCNWRLARTSDHRFSITRITETRNLGARQRSGLMNIEYCNTVQLTVDRVEY